MPNEDFTIESLPADTPLFMTEAWLGCVHWAIGELAAFRKDTGMNWEPGKTGLDRTIDKATGADKAFLKAFVLWVNENVWGPVDGEPGAWG